MRSWLCSASGLVVLTAGVLLYRWFSPSPHGYLELFFAIPLVALGLLVVGAGLAIGWSTIGWALKAIAGLLILAGLVPLALVAYFFLIAS